MTQEMESTVQALKTAIQMEIDGKEFYLKAAKAAGNQLGKKLLTKLAGEEDIHRQVFEDIYGAISRNQDWPTVEIKEDPGLKTILSDARNSAGEDADAMKEEIEAVRTAMEMENKTFDFYRARAARAEYPAEKELYNKLTAQEEGHHKALLSYYEYLKDPAAWYIQEEHHSLDGG